VPLVKTCPLNGNLVLKIPHISLLKLDV